MSRKNKKNRKNRKNNGTVKKEMSTKFNTIASSDNYGDFLSICKMTQYELKDYLTYELSNYGYTTEVNDGYLFCKEVNIPVLLTAHMDTVHKEEHKLFFENINKEGKHVLSSPQGIGGDDRCGVYMILSILKETEYRPAILFCEDEEIGGVGSKKFVSSLENVGAISNLKFFIELDRANANDLVFYDDINYKFHDFCKKATGYKENWGSFSDISILSPDSGVSSVNISCGYYNAHTLKEEVVWEDMVDSIKTTEKLLEKANEVEQFKYIESMVGKNIFNGYGFYDYGHANKYESSYSGVYNYNNTNSNLACVYDEMEIEIVWLENDIQKSSIYIGTTIEECFGAFFMEHTGVCFNDVTNYYEI